MKKTFIGITLFLLLFVMGASETYYVNDSMPDDNGVGTSWATAKKYIQSGLSLMSGGDTLIIADGIYTGSNNMIVSGTIPSGSLTGYTVIRANNDFGVIVDAEVVPGRVPFKMVDRNYFQVQGIEFRRPGDTGVDQESVPVWLIRCDYAKMVRVGAFECAEQVIDKVNNMSNIFVLSSSSYCLLEECYAYGYGKYIFLMYQSNNIILRRCIGRFESWSMGKSDIFSNYSSHEIIYQNCIALDFDQPRHWHPASNGLWGGFNQNGSTYNISYYGCIATNITGSQGVTLRKWDGTVYNCDYNPSFRIDAGANSTLMENCVSINNVDGIMTYGAATVRNCNLLTIYSDSSPDMNWYGRGIDYVSGGSPIVRNSIFYNNEVGAVKSTNSDYNALYDNASNYTNCSPGVNDYSSENGNEINVLWSVSNSSGGLKYPVRIESGSNLSGIGQSGADIGANIIKMYGVSGTLYGDPGYNILTDEELWPFPNEDIIKERMKVYNRWDPYDNIDPNNPANPNTYVNGARGFCADDLQLNGVDEITLTSYIWECLGNQMPDSIYSSVEENIENINISNLTCNIFMGTNFVTFSNLNYGDIVKIYNISGRLLNNSSEITGNTYKWNISDLPSGIYFYTINGINKTVGKIDIIR